MTRTSKVEQCMICGEVPCNCGGTKKPVKSGNKSTTPVLKYHATERDWTMEAAIQAIAPLLCSTDKQVHKNIIDPPFHNERQVLDWRREHGDPEIIRQARGRRAQ